MAIGTLHQILLSVRERAGPLAAFDVPTPNDIAAKKSLASDSHAWVMTIGQQWCGRRWELPRNSLRWTEVTTKHAYSDLAPAQNGFATQVNVLCGALLLIVARPSGQEDPASFSFLDQISRPLNAVWSSIELEAYHLKPGTTGSVSFSNHTLILKLTQNVQRCTTVPAFPLTLDRAYCRSKVPLLFHFHNSAILHWLSSFRPGHYCCCQQIPGGRSISAAPSGTVLSSCLS